MLGFHKIVAMQLQGVLVTYNPFVAFLYSFLVLVICTFLIVLANKYAPVLLGNRKTN